jgi:cobalt-zinc-cadmium efflux system membrane fusion protein
MMVILLLAAVMAGCGGSKTPSVTAQAAKPPSDPKAENTVILDDAARKQAQIVAEPAEARSLPEALRVTGRITRDENKSWRVGAVTDGRIVSVQVNAGDRVAQGQVLARMHSHDIHESRAAYRKAVGEEVRLKSMAAYSLRTRDRAKRLLDLKAASLEQVDHAETELRNAQAAVASAGIEVERVRNHLVEFLGVAAEEPEHHAGGVHGDEDLIPIKSPAAGIVLERNVTPGTVVEPASETFVISDLSSVWMIAQVGEEGLARLRAGMAVDVFVQAFPGRAFRGRIARLGDELDPTTRTVKARVDLTNPSGQLKPEMYAAAELNLGGTRPAVFVPEDAVQEVNNHPAVFIEKSRGRFEARPVETGRLINGRVEITSGVSAGEQVVTKGSFVLKSQLLKASLAEE